MDVQITVRAYGRLQDAVGRETTLSLPTGATVRDVLDELGVRGEAKIVLVNGTNVNHLDGAETALSAGDTVAVTADTTPE